MNQLHRIGTLLVIALALCVGCSSGSSSVMGTRVVEGSGVIVEQTRPLSGITAVVHSSEGALQIEQVPGGPEELRVRADENLLQHIVTEVQGGTLEIRTESGIDVEPTQSIELHLTVVDLESVVFAGVGEVEALGLAVDDLRLSSSGTGGMECRDLDATSLTVLSTGIGLVSCSGRLDRQTVTLSGVGGYEAPNLLSREAVLDVGGLNSATVNVSERLTATVDAGGSVSYIDSSGGGLIVDCTPSDRCSPR